MFAALYCVFRYGWTPQFSYQSDQFVFGRDNYQPDQIRLYTQAHVGEYRVDFLIGVHFPERKIDFGVVIECDGHEFHERTKEQAERDRSRDRDLQAKGFAIFRYTGSEIWADPNVCASEVFTFVYNKIQTYDRAYGFHTPGEARP